MSNMSYCRFENTANDLADCADVIEQMSFEAVAAYLNDEKYEGIPLAEGDEDEEELLESSTEVFAFKRMVEMCRQIVAKADEAEERR